MDAGINTEQLKMPEAVTIGKSMKVVLLPPLLSEQERVLTEYVQQGWSLRAVVAAELGNPSERSLIAYLERTCVADDG